ncbi:MAG: hypothetical protein COA79_01500 [Planctomycetota bacterium]|nr:MAG: hypothetical protein COA79_01500 [Planctomycetota bacterium]
MLKKVFSQPSLKEKRPCVGCQVPCNCTGSSTCTCKCNWDCEFISIEISSDPIHFPIEKYIIPLVYELNVLRLCPTYYSCEGHANDMGEVVKFPMVYFYSEIILMPVLFAEYIEQLKIDKILVYDWHIVALGFSPNMIPSYSMKINNNAKIKYRLDYLQNDIKKLSNGLAYNIQLLAKKNLNKLLA